MGGFRWADGCRGGLDAAGLILVAQYQNLVLQILGLILQLAQGLGVTAKLDDNPDGQGHQGQEQIKTDDEQECFHGVDVQPSHCPHWVRMTSSGDQVPASA